MHVEETNILEVSLTKVYACYNCHRMDMSLDTRTKIEVLLQNQKRGHQPFKPSKFQASVSHHIGIL